jgi:hypothetical protein
MPLSLISTSTETLASPKQRLHHVTSSNVRQSSLVTYMIVSCKRGSRGANPIIIRNVSNTRLNDSYFQLIFYAPFHIEMFASCDNGKWPARSFTIRTYDNSVQEGLKSELSFIIIIIIIIIVI